MPGGHKERRVDRIYQDTAGSSRFEGLFVINDITFFGKRGFFA
jgi:hypothetical protein